MRKLILTGILGVSFLVAAPQSNADEQSGPQKPIVAKVNGVPVTNQDLQIEINRIIPITSYHRKLSQERKSEFTKTALDNLILKELKFQAAKKRGLSVEKKIVKEELKSIRKKFKSKKEFKNALKRSNMTLDDLKERIKREKLVEILTKEQENLNPDITEEKMKDYYDNNREKFVVPETRRLRVILIKIDPSSRARVWKKKKALAEEVLAKIKEGEDFAELAKQFSDDKSRVNGGELGYIHNGQLISEVNNEAFKLKKGETSEILESIYGFHLVKVEDIIEKRQNKYEDLKKERLKMELERKEKREMKEAWIAGIKKDAKIEIFLEGFK